VRGCRVAGSLCPLSARDWKRTDVWASAVRPSRRPPSPEEPPPAAPQRGELLRVRKFLYAINKVPHAEERSKRASRSTHSVDAALLSTAADEAPCSFSIN